MVVGNIFGQADGLGGIGGDRQKNIIGIHQVAGMEGGRDGGHLLLVEIFFQGQGAAGGVVEVKNNALIQEIFKIPFGDIGFVLVVPDGTIDFVIAQNFHVVDKIEIILNTL
jgi:hypothetical protein